MVASQDAASIRVPPVMQLRVRSELIDFSPDFQDSDIHFARVAVGASRRFLELERAQQRVFATLLSFH